ncbi:MAG TPA: GMC family oxidoreductase [Longimicrobiales bacterium]|nr:GMC family oxidoreductase [Longimicrobiales bacterium]
MKTYRNDEQVDFVVVGSGASGGVLAKELSTNGFSVVVLEQGPWRQSADFEHDEFGYWMKNALAGEPGSDPVMWRRTDKQNAFAAGANGGGMLWAKGVGGSSVHFTANFWRFHAIDFNERSVLGEISGTGFADWPITYKELEPYYTKVDYQIGVSGAPGPFDPPRSRPFPLPPLPVKSSGVLLERGAKKLGYHAQPAPMAIPSRPYNGRPACQHCGYCIAYGCEFGAKSSTLVTMIPVAVKTGRCEIRPHSTVARVETGADGRATAVVYFDRDGKEQRQKAKAFVIAANGAETPRLLLMSASPQHPNGLANSSGLVGKYLMFNTQSTGHALFEHPLNEYKSVQVTRIVHDFYNTDPKRGFYGGGGIDARQMFGPIFFGAFGGPPEMPRWGSDFKKAMRELYPRYTMVAGHTTSLAMESNNITLDPNMKDRYGRAALRVTYTDHPDDLKTGEFLRDRAVEMMDAAGAQKTWKDPVGVSSGTAHLLGTCRMGNDATQSVIDADHRTHDVKNLFLCDGSSFVTSGRGQPTMTIMALAFRAADRISEAARKNAI